MKFNSETQHFEHLLHHLSERIARLALACNIDLSDSHLTEKILHDTEFAAQYTSHYYKELRGLLILRYLEEQRCAQNLGSATCIRLMMEAESHLITDGFTPGSDGCDPGKLLGLYQNYS